MATDRRTVEESRASSEVDYAKIDATTDEDVRRHMIEDGEDPDAPFAGFTLRGRASPLTVRQRSGLSQDKFEAALRIPVETLRNWEQGRVVPDLSAQSLLGLANDDPERAFRVLSGLAVDVEE